MTIDINAFYGEWPTCPVDGDIDRLIANLDTFGVDAAFVSPLRAVWRKNQQALNDDLMAATERDARLFPVPVLDPSLPTWEEEFGRLVGAPKVKMFKLHPNYVPYGAERMAPVFEACRNARVGVIAQVRMEDPRYQHPLAIVPDLDIGPVLDLAKDFPGLTLIVGGADAGLIDASLEKAKTLSGLYFDTSRIDGFDTVLKLCRNGLTARLLFGSNSPLFEYRSAPARIIADLSDAEAENILDENARKLFFQPAR